MQFGAKDQGLFLVGYFQEPLAHSHWSTIPEEEPDNTPLKKCKVTNKERDRLSPIQNRHDFVFFFRHQERAIRNGDPDNGNMPRRDQRTHRGVWSPMSPLKRKIRIS